MKINSVFLFLLSVLFLSANSSSAQAAGENKKCLKQKATVSISFINKSDTISAAKQKADSRLLEIREIAKQAGVKKIEVQNESISINNATGQSGETIINVNGNSSYSIDPTEAAQKFSEMLNEKGFMVNLNIRSYQETCN